MSKIDLKALINAHPECLDSSGKLKAFLLDLYPEDAARINIIAAIFSTGIAEEIKNATMVDSITLSTYISQLENTYGYSPKFSKECLDIWKEAYGKGLLQRAITPLTLSDEDFEIKNGILENYKGQGGNVTIPYGVTSINDEAFYDCISLTSIVFPNSLTTIGDSAFSGCINLTSITIPNSVTSIGQSAFELTPWLQNHGNLVIINNILICYQGNEESVEIPSGVTDICGGAFWGCSNLIRATIPSSVTSIGEWAFMECESLTSILIPNSVVNIGDNAFSGCCSLTNITIPDSVTNIEPETFKDCRNLTNITIPNSVTSIGYRAFENCSKLNSITIPDCVTRIGREAFQGCSNLIHISIPDSVSEIGCMAFDGTLWQRNHGFDTNIVNGILIQCDGFNNYGTINIPNGVTKIADDLFDRRHDIVDLRIPNGVNTIGNDAFLCCINLKSITIPDSVTSIGDSAFYGCKSLTSITIPASVTSIGKWAFEECESLTIYSPQGSYAAVYAKNNQISIKYI